MSKSYQLNLTSDDIAHVMIALGFMMGAVQAKDDPRFEKISQANMELANKISRQHGNANPEPK